MDSCVDGESAFGTSSRFARNRLSPSRATCLSFKLSTLLPTLSQAAGYGLLHREEDFAFFPPLQMSTSILLRHCFYLLIFAFSVKT